MLHIHLPMNRQQTSMTRKVGFASLIMMGSVVASRLIGLFREITIAYAGGAGGSVDAYQVAFILPEILNHCVASGFLSITFIPIFSRCLSADNEPEGWRLFSIIYNTFGVFLIVFITVSMISAPRLVTLLAPGITDPVVFNQAVRMTRIILPAQFFFFSGGLYMAVQFAKERFLVPALAPLVYNIGIIAGGVVLGPRLGMEGFAWGVLGGAFAGNFAIQLLGAKRQGMLHSLLINFRHPQFKAYVYLTIPLMAGLTMTFSTELLLKFFGSFLAPGNIAALNYALRVMFILVGFFGQAVGTASYPFMAGLAARGDMEGLNRLLNTTLKFLLLVIPVSVLFMVLRHEIVFILFQRGAFDGEATRLTAGLLPFILAGTVAFSAQTVVVRGYYAMQNTWFPAIVGTVCVIMTFPLFYLLMTAMQGKGIAIALSVSALFQTGVLFELWNRRSKNPGRKELYQYLCKIIGISILLGAVLWKLRELLCLLLNPSSSQGAILVCLISGVVFAVLFIGSGYLFNIREVPELVRKLKKRLPGQ